MLVLLLIAAGSLGASVRFSTEWLIRRIVGTDTSLGTWVCNMGGSLLAGFVMGSVMFFEYTEMSLIISVGFAGSYTTFSTWMLQAAVFIQSGLWRDAFYSIFGSIGAGVLFVFIGYALAESLFR
ncbi:CrcB family protein [Balneolaceae bacterium ANBcel3]|nr:CrcB family protein [Balneolaceae bacterium ANBcel3]